MVILHSLSKCRWKAEVLLKCMQLLEWCYSSFLCYLLPSLTACSESIVVLVHLCNVFWRIGHNNVFGWLLSFVMGSSIQTLKKDVSTADRGLGRVAATLLLDTVFVDSFDWDWPVCWCFSRLLCVGADVMLNNDGECLESTCSAPADWEAGKFLSTIEHVHIWRLRNSGVRSAALFTDVIVVERDAACVLMTWSGCGWRASEECEQLWCAFDVSRCARRQLHVADVIKCLSDDLRCSWLCSGGFEMLQWVFSISMLTSPMRLRSWRRRKLRSSSRRDVISMRSSTSFCNCSLIPFRKT